MSFLLLADLIRSLHCDAVPLFSSVELTIDMPSASVRFDEAYAKLLQAIPPTPPVPREPEDALLLLLAILSDLVSMQNSFSSLTTISNRALSPSMSERESANGINPFIPLSPAVEFSRLQQRLCTALQRWHAQYQDQVSGDILALYYYCRMTLACPGLRKLPRVAGYQPLTTDGSRLTEVSSADASVSDDALSLAWLVVEHVNVQESPLIPRISIWLPIILFHAALVVWWKLRSSQLHAYGSFKVLTVFTRELAELPWPCCIEMNRTITRLMGQGKK